MRIIPGPRRGRNHRAPNTETSPAPRHTAASSEWTDVDDVMGIVRALGYDQPGPASEPENGQ